MSCFPGVLDVTGRDPAELQEVQWQPVCSLAADADRVYVLTRRGWEEAGLVAYDARDGSVTWEVGLDRQAASVAVVDDQVLVGGSFGAAFETDAFDAATGEQRWSVDAASYAAIHDEGTLLMGRAIAGSDTGGPVMEAVGVSLADGSVRWAADIEPQALCSGVLVAAEGDELVGVGMADGTERWRVDVRPDPYAECAGDQLVLRVDGAVRALDPADGTIRWTVELGPVGPLAVLPGLVAVQVNDQLVALDADDGSRRWTVARRASDDPAQLVAISPALGVTIGGVWLEVRDLATGASLGRRPAGQQVRVTSPQAMAVSANRGTLEAFTLADLEVVWTLDADPDPLDLAVAGGRVYELGREELVAYG